MQVESEREIRQQWNRNGSRRGACAMGGGVSGERDEFEAFRPRERAEGEPTPLLGLWPTAGGRGRGREARLPGGGDSRRFVDRFRLERGDRDAGWLARPLEPGNGRGLGEPIGGVLAYPVDGVRLSRIRHGNRI